MPDSKVGAEIVQLHDAAKRAVPVLPVAYSFIHADTVRSIALIEQQIEFYEELDLTRESNREQLGVLRAELKGAYKTLEWLDVQQ